MIPSDIVKILPNKANPQTIQEILDRNKLMGVKKVQKEPKVAYEEYRFISSGEPYRESKPVFYERFNTKEDLDEFLKSNKAPLGFRPVKATYTEIE